MGTVYITANGCGVLRHETNRILTYLIKNGYTETTSPNDADIIVFVACGMTNEDVSFGHDFLSRLLAIRKEDSLLIVTGCLPAVDKEWLSRIPEVVVYTYGELNNLDQLINSSIKFCDVVYNVGLPEHRAWTRPQNSKELLTDCELIKVVREFYPDSTLEQTYNYCTKGEYIWKEDDIFQIRAGYGCSYACSYCSSRISVGKFKSEPFQKILNQYKEGLALGYKRFMLIGTELGNYGVDIGTNLAELVKELSLIDNTVRLGVRYIHPDCLVRLFDRLVLYMESGYLYYFCVAIQTASSFLLEKMNRNPNLEPFINCLTAIRNKHLPTIIHSQIMVGFPGESIGDVLDTLLLLDRSKFEYVNVNKFSPRPMTPAANMDNQIPEEEKEFRYEIVNEWLARERKESLYRSLSNAF